MKVEKSSFPSLVCFSDDMSLTEICSLVLAGGAGVPLRQRDKLGLRSWKGTKLEIFARLLEMQVLKSTVILKWNLKLNHSVKGFWDAEKLCYLSE